MAGRPYIQVKATGHRVYLDDPIEASFPELPKFICELCSRILEPWKLLCVRPHICLECVPTRGAEWRFGETSWEDYRFFGNAAAVLKALETEVKNGRRHRDAR